MPPPPGYPPSGQLPGGGPPPGGYGPPPGYPPGGAAGFPPPPPGGYGPPQGERRVHPTEPFQLAWERVKADPGTILGTLVLGMILASASALVANLLGHLVLGAPRYEVPIGNPLDPLAAATSGVAGL